VADAIDMKPEYYERQARYLQSIACLVKDAAKHDELQERGAQLVLQSDLIKRDEQAHRNSGLA
jgi:hypothetical protein